MSIESTELILYIDNEEKLYPQKQAIQRNLYKKKRKGEYERDKGRKGWLHLVNAGAKEYVRVLGSPGDRWHTMFTPDSRREAAAEYERRFRDDYDSYALEYLVPESKQRHRPGNPHPVKKRATKKKRGKRRAKTVKRGLRRVRVCPVGTEVQTLIFSKVIYTEITARMWAKKNGFKVTKIDETSDSYRMRQRPPERFTPGSFRTISVGSVQAVIGCPSRGGKTPAKQTPTPAKRRPTRAASALKRVRKRRGKMVPAGGRGYKLSLEPAATDPSAWVAYLVDPRGSRMLLRWDCSARTVKQAEKELRAYWAQGRKESAAWVPIELRSAAKKRTVTPQHAGDWRASVQRTRLHAKRHLDAGNLKDTPALRKAWADHKKLIAIVERLERRAAGRPVTTRFGTREKRVPHKTMWLRGWRGWVSFDDDEGKPKAWRDGFKAAAEANESGGQRPNMAQGKEEYPGTAKRAPKRRIRSQKLYPTTPLGAANFAHAVAKELAKELPQGTTRIPDSPRLIGTVKYANGYVVLLSGVGLHPAGGGKFVWAKAVKYGAGERRAGHGFVTHPRDLYVVVDDDATGTIKAKARKVATVVKKFDKTFGGTAAKKKPNPTSGLWVVESRGASWYIVHPTKGAKRIGPARMRGTNYYDKARAEADKRNKVSRGASPKKRKAKTVRLPKTGTVDDVTNEQAEAWLKKQGFRWNKAGGYWARPGYVPGGSHYRGRVLALGQHDDGTLATEVVLSQDAGPDGRPTSTAVYPTLQGGESAAGSHAGAKVMRKLKMRQAKEWVAGKVRGARGTAKAGNPHYKSMAAIKRANKAYAAETSRAYWFEKGAMRYFNTRIHGTPVHHKNTNGSFFITSERMDDRFEWKYAVRHARPDGFIDTIGDMRQYDTEAQARAAAKLTARTGVAALAS